MGESWNFDYEVIPVFGAINTVIPFTIYLYQEIIYGQDFTAGVQGTR